MAIKSLPLSELEVTAVLYIFDIDEDGRPDYDMEVLSDLDDTAVFGKFERSCDCCGHKLKYACRVVHIPTNIGYYIGRQCAAKIDALKGLGGKINDISVALAERAACNLRETKWLQGQTHLTEAFTWAKSPQASKLAEDFVQNIRRFGSLTPKQLEFFPKLYEQYLEKLELIKEGVRCPSGKVEIKGTIKSIKKFQNAFGDVFKMLVDIGNGVKVYGTRPKKLAEIEIGREVRFLATVEPTEKDPLFGIFSRPTQVEIL